MFVLALVVREKNDFICFLKIFYLTFIISLHFGKFCIVCVCVGGGGGGGGGRIGAGLHCTSLRDVSALTAILICMRSVIENDCFKFLLRMYGWPRHKVR